MCMHVCPCVLGRVCVCVCVCVYRFAKYGVPHGCRAGVWEVALGLTPGELPQVCVCVTQCVTHT